MSRPRGYREPKSKRVGFGEGVKPWTFEDVKVAHSSLSARRGVDGIAQERTKKAEERKLEGSILWVLLWSA